MKKQISQYKLIHYLHKQMISWKSEMLQNGKFITLDEMDWSRYKTIPIPLIKKYHVGICWDFVNYQTHIFRKWNIKHESYMIISKKNYNNHTFTIVDINGDLYWVESCWKLHFGIHRISSIDDVLSKINADIFFENYELMKYNSNGLDVGLSFKKLLNKIKEELNMGKDYGSDNINHEEVEKRRLASLKLRWKITDLSNARFKVKNKNMIIKVVGVESQEKMEVYTCEVVDSIYESIIGERFKIPFNWLELAEDGLSIEKYKSNAELDMIETDVIKKASQIHSLATKMDEYKEKCIEIYKKILYPDAFHHLDLCCYSSTYSGEEGRESVEYLNKEDSLEILKSYMDLLNKKYVDEKCKLGKVLGA